LIESLGLCEIEQTEKGWYITLIDKDPDAVKREMDTERKDRMDLDDEQRRQKLIAEQIKRDQDRGIEQPEPVYTELVRKDEEEKVQVTFNQNVVVEKKKVLAPSILVTSSKKRTSTADDASDDTEAKKSKIETTDEPTKTNSVFKKPLPVATKPKKSALEEVREVISHLIL
jgi:DNA/RNA-binding protein KIN17